MGNYTIFLKFKNPRRGRQARNFSENDPKKEKSQRILRSRLLNTSPAAVTHRSVTTQSALLFCLSPDPLPLSMPAAQALYCK